MSPNFLSILAAFVMLFPFLFNFYIFFYFQTYYDLGIAMKYYIGLLLSLITGLLIKKLLSIPISKVSSVAHLRLDLIVNYLKKIVVNKKKACHIIENPIFPNLGILSLYTVFYGYVISYFSFTNIIIKRERKWNIFIMLSLLFTMILHWFYQLDRGCVRSGELFLGFLVGLGFGIGWYFAIDKIYWDNDKNNEYRREDKNCKFYGKKYMCSKEI
jgi:hypothetical protein